MVRRDPLKDLVATGPESGRRKAGGALWVGKTLIDPPNRPRIGRGVYSAGRAVIGSPIIGGLDWPTEVV